MRAFLSLAKTCYEPSTSRRLLTSLAVVLLSIAGSVAHAKRADPLPRTVPVGLLLPVKLKTTLTAEKTHAGDAVEARLSQRVPLGTDRYIPQGTALLGSIIATGPNSVSLLFTELKRGASTTPIAVRLIGAATWYEVYQTQLPVGGTDRSTSSQADWTTKQIGDDEVYRSAGSGDVYNDVSEKVGHADLQGVYSFPNRKTGLPLALGPFSTTAKGLYGFSGVSLAAPGGNGAPIVLHMQRTGHWRIESPDALLLQVVR